MNTLKKWFTTIFSSSKKHLKKSTKKMSKRKNKTYKKRRNMRGG
jgi:hypothetical protein